MVARILGSDAASITCVMANAPGPLELLPTRDYPPGWLRFEREANGQYEELAPPLPQADPYEEIYSKRVQDVWWGMVDETLIDPAELGKGDNLEPVEMYMEALRKARQFHEQLRLYFHPQTYAHYGSDKEQVTFGAVRWVTTDRIPDNLRDALTALPPGEWTVSGKATLGEGEARVRLKLDSKRKPASDGDEDAGDVTVPRHSGRLVEDGGENVKLVCRMKGFDHQGSYKHPDVLSNVTYCLGKLIQLATPIDQLPQTKGSSWSEPSAADSAESASLFSPEPVQ
jgi:hypothetical protein